MKVDLTKEELMALGDALDCVREQFWSDQLHSAAAKIAACFPYPDSEPAPGAPTCAKGHALEEARYPNGDLAFVACRSCAPEFFEQLPATAESEPCDMCGRKTPCSGCKEEAQDG